MLKPQAFGNAFGLTAIIIYIVLFALRAVAEPFFKLLLNAQFMGADIASQVPNLNFANFLGILIAVGVFSWVFGYLMAVIYNRFAK